MCNGLTLTLQRYKMISTYSVICGYNELCIIDAPVVQLLCLSLFNKVLGSVSQKNLRLRLILVASFFVNLSRKFFYETDSRTSKFFS